MRDRGEPANQSDKQDDIDWEGFLSIEGLNNFFNFIKEIIESKLAIKLSSIQLYHLKKITDECAQEAYYNRDSNRRYKLEPIKESLERFFRQEDFDFKLIDSLSADSVEMAEIREYFRKRQDEEHRV